MRIRTTGLVVALTCALLAFAGAAGGIVGGTPDTTTPYRYPSVALIEVKNYVGPYWFPGCTGTLVAPDMLLTAGHCVLPLAADLLAPTDYRVTFDPAPQTVLQPDRPDSVHIAVSDGYVNPEYLLSAAPGNSKAAYGSYPDIGILVLAEDVPAPLVPIVGPDALTNAKGTAGTVVGYGANGFSRGAWGTPSMTMSYDGFRNFRDTSVINDHDVASAYFLKLAGVSCFGDSGAPFLVGGKIAGVDSFGQSRECSGPGYYTRLDTEPAQTFLEGLGL